MTAVSAASAAYIVSALLFVLSLAGLSRHETAKSGNAFGIAGMAIALAATVGLAARSIEAAAVVGVAAALLFLAAAFSPNQLIGNLTVFALAVVVGFYVIGNVHHALHTPLMSVTNAISGIIVVGALLQIGHGDPVVTTVAVIAVLLASINVFGGFAVTRRMLGMFTRG